MSEVGVLVHQTWRVAKKDTPGVLLRRVIDGGPNMGPVAIDLLATDSPLGSVSATARAVRKFPDLWGLARDVQLPGAPTTVRGLSTSGTGGRIPIAMDLLLGVLDGVPRSFPFHQVGVMLSWPVLEEAQLRVTDMWWINGRMRALTLTWKAAADPKSKDVPVATQPLATLIATLGKPKSTVRQPTGDALTTAPRDLFEITQRYRSTLSQRASELPLPHRLATDGLGQPAGPMKPVLVAAFASRGYDCRGEHGALILKRRTAANHVVELSLDVGTWSHSFTGHLIVHVPGFRASLPLLVAPGSNQVPIAGASGWAQLVDNLVVVVDDLEASFVPEIEAQAGPAPDWFEPG